MFFLQERDIVTIAPTPSKVDSCSERHMYEELRKSLREHVRKWSVKNACYVETSFCCVPLPLHKWQLQLTPALLPFDKMHVPTKIQQTHKPKVFFFLLLFFSGEHAMQNVLSCNHRMFYFHCSECSGVIQCSASVPITVNRERRAESPPLREKLLAQKNFLGTSSSSSRVNISTWVWNVHVKTNTQASIYFTDYYVIAGTDLKK